MIPMALVQHKVLEIIRKEKQIPKDELFKMLPTVRRSNIYNAIKKLILTGFIKTMPSGGQYSNGRYKQILILTEKGDNDEI